MSADNLGGNEKGSLPTFLIVILATVFIGISVIAGYILGGGFNIRDNKKTESQNAIVNDEKKTDDVPMVTSTGKDVFLQPTSSSNNVPVVFEGSVIKLPGLSFDLAPYHVLDGDQDSSVLYQYVSLSAAIADKIQWIGFYPIDRLGFFNPEHNKTANNGSTDGLGVTDYYLAGWFEYGGENGLVVFADVSCDDMGCGGGPYSPFILYNNQVVLLSRYKPPSDSMFFATENPLDHIVRSQVKIDKDFQITYLEFPAQITIKPGIVLDYVSTEPASENAGLIFRGGSLTKKVATLSVWGDVYLEQTLHNFYLLGRDGRERVYEYIPDVFKDREELSTVVFNDGLTINGYRHWSMGGCGRSGLSIVEAGKIDVAKDLKEVGRTTSGLKVLGLVNSDQQILHDFYNSIFFPAKGEKISYEDFVRERPAVFWVDPLDRLIMLQLNKFAPIAECGKPVIYLYPQEDVRVKVNLQVEKFSYTEPEYGKGWQLLAKPNGEIVNLVDGKKYPYLLWEGTGVGEQPKADSGFVLAREEVDRFFNDKLPQLGLQGREISDFIEFWRPRMINAPYYFVTFYGTKAMEQIAPLKVEPKPDTVIRILMDYHPLEKPAIVQEQELFHRPRTGFTVIEWGGVLGRE